MTNSEGNPSSTGEVQTEAVFKTVSEWKLEDKIVAFVFDTRLQKKLGRRILFLACRHHVHERIVKNCWYKIFPKDPSPHCQLFVDLSREWVSLDTSPEAKVQMVHLPASERKAVIQFYKNFYMKVEKVLLRQDYKELVEISLELLGSQLPAGKQFKWKKVGAVHKARFMAWSLCSMKAFAFANDLNFSEETKEKLWRFALFQVGTYILHFLMSSC